MDLDTLLARTGEVDADGAALARGRAALDAATHRSATVVALKRRRQRRVALGTLVAAAASLVVLLPTVGLNGSPTASADAAQVLIAAGRSAGAQRGDWQAAAYWRSTSRYQQGEGPAHTRQIWIGHSQPGVLKDDGLESRYIPLEVALFPAGARGISWDGLWDLPTDAKALDRQLRAGIDGAGPDDDTEMFVIVGDLLRESPAPPALRKALWEVAATIPGVELAGAATDAEGRAGVAVVRGEQHYVVDPSTGRLLEERSYGHVATYLEQGPVEAAPPASALPSKG